MNEVKLSSGKNAYMRSMLVEADRVAAGTLISVSQAEGHGVSGVAKKIWSSALTARSGSLTLARCGSQLNRHDTGEVGPAGAQGSVR